MYSPYHPQEVPDGYSGSTFPPSAPPQDSPCEAPPEATECGAKSHGGPSPLASLFAPLSKFGFGKFDLKEFFSQDLLLIVIALLLLSSKEDECEEKDEDLWLLLILLFFMK